MSTLMIDPVRLYQINGQVATPASTHIQLTVTTNVQVVAAVSGKRIRVMGLLSNSDGTTSGQLFLKSSTSGSPLIGLNSPPNTLTPFLLPPVDSGYFETVTGEGLFADVETTAILLTVFYIVYTP